LEEGRLVTLIVASESLLKQLSSQPDILKTSNSQHPPMVLNLVVLHMHLMLKVLKEPSPYNEI